ncbi:50S ribosomal protein L24 [Nanoarchaeota archaeon NZ13-N]|uniref:Large ribosomal subunit protein eL24 n=1 Tax=Candidatus Nanoclepta minutus TaxID=1940235 RepID=A0A397WP98_9ARCH|nr:MAG: 50S ribosomal protein L24 [Nanoarchaeota archaeon NZ13-N]RIB35329.1 MAG: 50S ribosomal protein L24 [Candidatus Nanoclepta minutus]
MEERICSFCGNKLEPGTGLIYVLNDGRVLYFCSRKCYRNWEMGRNPKKYKWASVNR